MSKALDFLLQARPEAMQAYFSFLKKSGSHLDAKTAALISVITKVHAKTANGLRQYLPRALKAGASADEVIDALLMAMPALGFSKIVWAIDIILDMNLSEFGHYLKENLPDRNASTAPVPQWRSIFDVAALADGETRFVKNGGEAYYVRRDGERAQVYSARCPHRDNIIPESGCAHDTLACPFHEWKFDLKTGRCIAGGTKPLTAVAAKVEAGKIWVQ